jgi:hypothetical protein
VVGYQQQSTLIIQSRVNFTCAWKISHLTFKKAFADPLFESPMYTQFDSRGFDCFDILGCFGNSMQVYEKSNPKIPMSIGTIIVVVSCWPCNGACGFLSQHCHRSVCQQVYFLLLVNFNYRLPS